MAQTIKVVLREREIELSFIDLDLPVTATDAQLVQATERHLDQKLDGFAVTRHEDHVMISSEPVFG